MEISSLKSEVKISESGGREMKPVGSSDWRVLKTSDSVVDTAIYVETDVLDRTDDMGRPGGGTIKVVAGVCSVNTDGLDRADEIGLPGGGKATVVTEAQPVKADRVAIGRPEGR